MDRGDAMNDYLLRLMSDAIFKERLAEASQWRLAQLRQGGTKIIGARLVKGDVSVVGAPKLETPLG
jgi:hypothetical protein